MKVLVVEQDLGSRLAYVAIARSGGWEAISCDHSADVIALIREHRIGVLITDHSLAVGFATLQKVRGAGLRLPAILVTSNHFKRSEAQQLGIEAVLSKPPDVSALRAALTNVGITLNSDSDFAVIFRFLERCEAKERAPHHSSVTATGAVAHVAAQPQRVWQNSAAT